MHGQFAITTKLGHCKGTSGHVKVAGESQTKGLAETVADQYEMSKIKTKESRACKFSC